MNKMIFRDAIKKFVPKARENSKIYIYGTGDNWKNIRRMYLSFTNVKLEDQVDFFVDGNPEKNGCKIGNTPIVSPDDIDLNDCLIFISANSFEKEIGHTLKDKGLIPCYDFYDSFYIVSILFEYIIEQSMKLRNTCKGKKCFVIGNGPSLKAEDLDLIHNNNIDSFGVNQIFKIFDQTQWRPTYYVASDFYAVSNFEEFNTHITGIKFINAEYAKIVENFHTDNAYFFMENANILLLSHIAVPQVSEKIYDLSSGGTTLFTALQLAFYLGYSEIYLLGVDNTFPVEKSADGELIINNNMTKIHFIDEKEYLPDLADDGLYDAQFGYQNNAAYLSAFKYAKEHNVILKNATRGGNLDYIERIEFGKIF